MLRGNLSTRPFYNERAVQALLGGLAIALALLSLFTVWQFVDLTRPVRIARDDRRAVVTAFFPTTPPIQLESIAGRALRRTVALVAIVGKNRTDFAFEEFQLVFGGRLGLRLRPGGSTEQNGAKRNETANDYSGRSHARIPFTTSPKLSVSRKSRPL